MSKVPISTRVGTALQINMHPHDIGHVPHILPHQLRCWEGQVDRIVLTVDGVQSRTGRYAGTSYAQNRQRLIDYLDSLRRHRPGIVVDAVDYGREARAAVGRQFFAEVPAWPDKAFDGGPFYAYFYGLNRANANYVLHMDSDMLFGGGSQTWIDEAIAFLRVSDRTLFVGPFPGPPTAQGGLDEIRHGGFPGTGSALRPDRLALEFPAYRFTTVSTRIFLMDMRRFAARVGSLELLRPDRFRRLRARAYGQSPLTMPAEEMLSANMMRLGLNRVDMLGSGPGMYSLHPPYRSGEFYEQLPALVGAIESGDIPEGQRGDFDINSSMLDWSSALADKTPARRIVRAVRQLIAVNLRRLSVRP